MHASSGRTEPTGTLRAKEGPAAKAAGCGGGKRHPWPSQGLHPDPQAPRGSSSLPNFSAFLSLSWTHGATHLSVPLGLVRSVPVPLLTSGRLRTRDPRLHRAQEMEALWSVPASEAGPWMDVPRARALLWLETCLLCGRGPVLFLTVLLRLCLDLSNSKAV